MKHFFNLLPLISIPFIILGLIFFAKDYVDPLEACYIQIDGYVLSGNEKTIKQALKNIKKSDYGSYRDICTYTKKIIEQRCLNTDPYFGYPETISEGCYIKGSKILYLLPEENESPEIIKKRQELITKYGALNKLFWENNN